MLAKLLEAIEAKGELDRQALPRSASFDSFHCILIFFFFTAACVTLLNSHVSTTIYSIQVIRFATPSV